MKLWRVAICAIIILTYPFFPIIGSLNSVEKIKGADWTHTNNDERGTNFNPQTQINVGNVFLLQDDWFYPYGIVPPVYGYDLPLGSSAKPLAINGIVYIPTNYLRIDAINLLNANPVWTYSYPTNITDIPRILPNVRSYDPGRIRGISYSDGNVYYPTPDCSILSLDALSGIPKFLGDLSGGRMCKDVSGNSGFYTGQMLYGPVFYEKGGVLITGAGVSGRVDSGRGFIAGYDVKTGKLLWRFFLMPPAGGDPQWSLRWKGKGNVEPVEGDWGNAIGVGVGAGAGQWAVDEETGIVYVTTSAPGPKWNASHRPGPNLLSSSLLALDAMSGELIWYYQFVPHDVNGLGCDWNVILGKTVIQGVEKKVIYKGCGNGLVHALDAGTGKIIWVFKPPSVKYLNTPNALYPITGTADLSMPLAKAPSRDGYWQCPGITGAISSDMAFAYDMVFVATYNFCDYMKPSSAEPGMLDSFGADFPKPPYEMPRNTTIYGLNASSGELVWTFQMENEGYTGGLLVSGGVLYATAVDKNWYALDARTGKLLFKRLIGSPVTVGPILAANALGRHQLLISAGGHAERWGRPVSGFVSTLALREIPTKPEGKPPSATTDIVPVLITLIAVPSVLVLAWLFRRRKLRGN